jgi:hypothetical protein
VTVGELLARMSAAEIAEWQAYATLTGGLRDQRMEIHAAQAMALLANVHRGKGKPPYRVQDFLPPDPERADAAAAPRRPMSDFGALLERRATE